MVSTPTYRPGLLARVLESTIAAVVISVTVETARRMSGDLGLITVHVPHVDPGDGLSLAMTGAYLGFYLGGRHQWRLSSMRRFVRLPVRALDAAVGASARFVRGLFGGILAFLAGELVMSLCLPDVFGRSAGFAAAGVVLAGALTPAFSLPGDLRLRAVATGAFAGCSAGFLFSLTGLVVPGDPAGRLGAVGMLTLAMGLTWPEPRGLLDASGDPTSLADPAPGGP